MRRGIVVVCALFGVLSMMDVRSVRCEDLVSLDTPKACESLDLSRSKIEWLRPGALRVKCELAEWPGVHFKAGRAYDRQDWREFGALAVDVANLSAEPVAVCVRIDDDAQADGRVHCRTGKTELAPNERATLVLPIESSIGMMRAGPPFDFGPNARVMQVHGSALDLSHIVAFLVFLPRPATARTLEIANIRLLPRQDMRGIVDKFGQFARAEWPGKLHDESEFAKRAADEERWLQGNRPPADRDEFGGWKGGPQLKATGFFRTAMLANNTEISAPKTAPPGSRWWLVTPTGHLFWSIGVTCARPHSEGPIRDIESMFSWLPEEARKRKQVDFYAINLKRRYGEDWPNLWVDVSCERLRSWGFNTIANWSDASVFRARRVPYTVPLYYGGNLPYISVEEYKRKPGTQHRPPDFFDARFPQALDAAVAKGTAEWRDDPWCLGYFVDNELAWDTWAQMGTGGEYVTAREALAAPASLAAHQAFVGQLQKKYGTIDKFNAAWGTKAASWDEQIKVAKEQLSDASRADCSAFMTALAERYFSTVAAAMKKYAPKQLYLGPRFAIRPREVVEVSAKYCDVVSFNIYRPIVDPKDWAFTASLGKPVIIGEFHFGATDRGLFHPGLGPVLDQAERAKAYQEYVRSVMALPTFVGCHWFQYVDEPLTGRFDGENYNIGLVTVTDTPYPELRAAARETNSDIYRLLAK